MSHCMRHFEEPVVALCRTCNRPFCSRCLVYSFGPNKPPYCVGCALTASGVRNGGKTVVAVEELVPTVDKRMERAQRRAEKVEAKAAKRAAKRGDQPIVEPVAARTSNVPVPKGLSTPASRFASASTEHAVG